MLIAVTKLTVIAFTAMKAEVRAIAVVKVIAAENSAVITVASDMAVEKVTVIVLENVSGAAL